MATDPSAATVVETQAISFIFQVALALLTLLVTIILVFMWSMAKDIKANTKNISAVDKAQGVKEERDTHIDRELGEIKKSVKELDIKFDKVIEGYNKSKS